MARPASPPPIIPVSGSGNLSRSTSPPPAPTAPRLSAATNVSAPAADVPYSGGVDRFILGDVIKNAPPWLLSAIVHMLLLIILGLWVLTSDKAAVVELKLFADREGEQLDQEFLDSQGEDQIDPAVTLESESPSENPLAALVETDFSIEPLQFTNVFQAEEIGYALTGREPGMKNALLAAYGGTEKTEAAVLATLEWLARNQRKDGSWSLAGPYEDGIDVDNPAAATAMAVMAFLGAGHTHQGKSSFQGNVTRGIKVLLNKQRKSGDFFSMGPSNHRFYTNAQCAIALCEAYAMTHDAKLKEPAQKAVDYLVENQDEDGGWRYFPRQGSDTSVTGWVVMALQSAQMGYLYVPPKTLEQVGRYLNRVSTHKGQRYLYGIGQSHGGSSDLAMTAEGLLCRQYLGWPKSDPRLRGGVEFILQDVPDWSRRDVYYWYYATQVCHHMEGKAWQTWNRTMRELIPENQVRSGREKGSWDPAGDQWGHHGGRLFVTCLSVYMLEVYYRHLPIYQHQRFMGR